MHICVIGGGVVGVTTAYCLARDGHQVTVIEQRSAAGRVTSLANGGQLSYSYVAPLAGPSVWRYLPRWLFDRTAPLRFVPSLNIHQWRWCVQFLGNCRRSISNRTTLDLLKLAAYSRDLLHQLLATDPLEFDFRNSGKLVIYRDMRELADGRRQMEFQLGHGGQQKALTALECIDREPALQQLEGRFAGGIFTPSEETGDCHRFTRALAGLLAKRYGVLFQFGVRLDKLRLEGETVVAGHTTAGDMVADGFVVAMGSDSARLLRSYGISLPVYPLKGHSLTLPVSAKHDAPTLSITDIRHKVVYARLGDKLRIAGMVDFTPDRAVVDVARVGILKQRAMDTLPNAGDYENATQWTGARPATPDGKPFLGRARYKNLWLNVGHGALGFTLALASARLVADSISHRASVVDIEPFGHPRGVPLALGTRKSW